MNKRLKKKIKKIKERIKDEKIKEQMEDGEKNQSDYLFSLFIFRVFDLFGNGNFIFNIIVIFSA